MHKLDMAHKALLICTFAFVLYIAISCTLSFSAYESVVISDKEPLSVVSEDTGEAVAPLTPDELESAAIEAEGTSDAVGGETQAGEQTASESSSAASGTSSKPSSNTPIGIININTAGVYELDRLPGVGAATAEKIIAYRNEHGPFKSVEDLILVSGIGEKKLANMRAYVTVE